MCVQASAQTSGTMWHLTNARTSCRTLRLIGAIPAYLSATPSILLFNPPFSQHFGTLNTICFPTFKKLTKFYETYIRIKNGELLWTALYHRQSLSTDIVKFWKISAEQVCSGRTVQPSSTWRGWWWQRYLSSVHRISEYWHLHYTTEAELFEKYWQHQFVPPNSFVTDCNQLGHACTHFASYWLM